jgi:hypothetical protein
MEVEGFGLNDELVRKNEQAALEAH